MEQARCKRLSGVSGCWNKIGIHRSTRIRDWGGACKPCQAIHSQKRVQDLVTVLGTRSRHCTERK